MGKAADGFTGLRSQPLHIRLGSVAVFLAIYLLLTAVWDVVLSDKSFGHGLVSNVIPGLIVGAFTFLVLPEVAVRWQRSRDRRRSRT